MMPVTLHKARKNKRAANCGDTCVRYFPATLDGTLQYQNHVVRRTAGV